MRRRLELKEERWQKYVVVIVARRVLISNLWTCNTGYYFSATLKIRKKFTSIDVQAQFLFLEDYKLKSKGKLY